jgi:hypothetical protein
VSAVLGKRCFVWAKMLLTGLPDGIFAYQKYQFGYILDGLGMENACIFYCRLVPMFYEHFVYIDI